MKTVIVMAMQGVPPKDFPREELAELIALYSRVGCAESGSVGPQVAARYAELDKKVRDWPRTGKNDPFFGAAKQLATHVASDTGHEVVVGYCEFGNPSIDEAFDLAVDAGAARVVVLTPTITRGGDQAETGIPIAIRRAQGRHPSVEFAYVWPLSPSRVGKFLATQLRTYL